MVTRESDDLVYPQWSPDGRQLAARILTNNGIQSHLALDRILKGRTPRRVLDVGTGSGVLAIAAAKACRSRVLASDIDRVAVALARANAWANGVAALVEIVHTGGLADRRFRARFGP